MLPIFISGTVWKIRLVFREVSLVLVLKLDFSIFFHEFLGFSFRWSLFNVFSRLRFTLYSWFDCDVFTNIIFIFIRIKLILFIFFRTIYLFLIIFGYILIVQRCGLFPLNHLEFDFYFFGDFLIILCFWFILYWTFWVGIWAAF